MRTSQPSSGPSPAAIEPFTKLPPGTWSLRGQKRSVLSPHGYGHLGSAASAAPTTRGSAESARTSATAAPGIALPLRRAASATMMGSWGHVDVRDQAYKGLLTGRGRRLGQTHARIGVWSRPVHACGAWLVLPQCLQAQPACGRTRTQRRMPARPLKHRRSP